MKLNNKGFAISSIMYIILIFSLVLVVAILGLLSSRKMTLDKIKKKTINEVKSNLNKKVYYVGNKIKVNGEYYYVIADSYRNQDYVTALKEKPLTKQEIEQYGQGHINVNTRWYNSGEAGVLFDRNGLIIEPQYGVIAYHSNETCGPSSHYVECSVEYNDSDIKYIVDGWMGGNLSDKLKTVDGYKARLLISNELNNLGCINGDCKETPYTWIYDMNLQSISYRYWLMDGYAREHGNIFYYMQYEYYYNTMTYSIPISLGSPHGDYGLVRPVINVYKSAIESE